MRRTAIALASVLVAAAALAGSAGSATSKATFQVFVDSTLSGASNGLVLETEMEGQVNVADTSRVRMGAAVREMGGVFRLRTKGGAGRCAFSLLWSLRPP